MLRKISKQKYKSRQLASTSQFQARQFSSAATYRSQILQEDLSQGFTYAENRENLIQNKNSIVNHSLEIEDFNPNRGESLEKRRFM